MAHWITLGKEFNNVPVRVAEKDLPRAVRSLFTGLKCNPRFLQMLFPVIQIIHTKGEMISPIMG